MEVDLVLIVHRDKQVCFDEILVGSYFVSTDFPTNSDPLNTYNICRKISTWQYVYLVNSGYVFEYQYDKKAPNHYQAVLDRNYDASQDTVKAFSLELENLKLKAEVEALKAQLAGLPQPRPQDAVLGGF